MADEAGEAGGGAAAGGSVLKKYGPLAAIVLLAQVVLAWVVIQVTIKDKVGTSEPDEPLMPKAEQPGKAAEEGVVSTALPFYLVSKSLDKITANPAGTNSQRFVVVSVQLGLVGQNEEEPMAPADIGALPSLAEIESNIGKIKAIIVSILMKKYVDQFESEMPAIAEEMQKEINRQVFDKISWDEDGKIKVTVSEVIFTDRIIQ